MAIQIDLNQDLPLAHALRERMAKEYGETAQANFLLSIIVENQAKYIGELQNNAALREEQFKAREADLGAANTRMNEEIRALRAEQDAQRKRVRKTVE